MSEQIARNRHCYNAPTIIELVPSIAPESFGLGYAALNLAAELNRAGVSVFLASVDEKSRAYDACEEARFPRENLINGMLLGPQRLRLSPFLIRRLSEIPTGGNVVIHLHGLWTFMSYAAGVLRRRWRCPLVVSPHGSLEPYALTMSPKKKAIASLLFEHRNLMTASCICALSAQEEASIRTYGYGGRIATIPNGVNHALECSAEEVSHFRSRYSIPAGSRVALFLSRIARKKNLPLLLRTFAKNLKIKPDWVLVIAGSDEGGHIREVNALVCELGISNSTRIIGPVTGREKACAFTSASFFALPSHSEGLPIAVLEAMEYAKPVLVTDGWSLPVATSAQFGWKAPARELEFGDILLKAMSTPEAALSGMGEVARRVARENFSWNVAAQKTCSVYLSLLARDETSEMKRDIRLQQ